MQRILRGFVPRGAFLGVVLDSFVYALSLIALVWAVRGVGSANAQSIGVVVFLCAGVLMAAANAAIGLYRTDARLSLRTLVRVAAGCAVTGVAIYWTANALLAARAHASAPEAALFAWALGLGLVRPSLYALQGAGVGVRRILIVGAGAEAIAIYRDLQQGNEYNTQLIGFFEAGPLETGLASNGALFPRSAGLWNVVKRWRINEVIVAVREQRGGVLPLRDLLECRIHGVRVVDETASFEQRRGEFPIESLKASWLIYGHGFEQGAARTFGKRVVDVAGSLVLLVLLSPVMAVAALAIVLESPGPAIFRQERVGLGGRCFQVLKLRSMRQDAEKDGVARWATASDSRVTRVGRLIRKTRIDELPQLINVLRGDMSLVGPRPERPNFVETLKEDIRFYDVRHSVKPGVTGWAQIRYRYAASLEDSRRKLQFDLYYVKNHTLWLDLRILLETVRVVLRGEGAQ